MATVRVGLATAWRRWCSWASLHSCSVLYVKPRGPWSRKATKRFSWKRSHLARLIAEQLEAARVAESRTLELELLERFILNATASTPS